MNTSLRPAARRSVLVLGSLGIALIVAAMGYALIIGWLNHARIGV